jgi:hypothetical protein
MKVINSESSLNEVNCKHGLFIRENVNVDQCKRDISSWFMTIH